MPFKRCYIILNVCVYLAIAGPALAEDVTWRGLTFRADEISSIDSENVRVSALGNSVIVAKKDLERRLAKIFLTNSEQAKKFDLSAVQAFLKASLAEKDLDSATLALEAIVSRASLEDDFIRRILPNLTDEGQLVELFKAYVGKLEADRVGSSSARVLYELARRDANWVRTSALRGAYANSAEIHGVARRDFESSIKQRAYDSAQVAVEVLRKLYGDSDESARSLTLALYRVREVERVIGSGEIEKVAPLLEAAKRETETESLLMPLFVEAIHRIAKEEIEANKLNEALLILSRIEPARTTPTTHELVRAALGRVSGKQTEILLDSRVSTALKLIASKDQLVADTFVDVLERSSLEYLSRSDIALSTSFFEVLRNVRPDPSSENDDVRVAQAAALVGNGMREAAKRRLRELSGRMSLGDRILLLRAGYFGNPVLIFCFLLFPIVLLGLIYYRIKYRELEEAVEETPLESRPPPSYSGSGEGSVVSLGRALSPRSQEYVNLLRVIGLDGDASLKDIKTAYRAIVKEVHPDSQAADPESSDRFIELTSVYKRIVELRKELGYSETE